MKRLSLILALVITCLASVYGQSSVVFGYEQTLPSDTVTCIAQDADGNVLIGTRNGLVSYDGTDFSLITIADGLAGNSINDICVASDGKIYVATTTGVSIRNNNSWQNDFTGSDIRKIAATSNGKFWYSTRTNTVVEYNSGTTTVLPDNYGFSSGVTGIFTDRSHNVWVSCNGNLVEICANGKVKSFSDIFYGKVVYYVYHRFNGDLLVATSTGVMSYDYNSWTSIDGINVGASAVCEDFAQNIIYGNLNGIYKYDGTSSVLLNDKFSAEKLMVSSLPNKRIWCVDMQNGVAVMDFNGNAETYHTNRTLLNHTPNFIWGDNAGTVCIAGNGGINIVSDFTWLSYKRNLQNLTVNAMCLHNDTVWIGTNNSLLRKAGINVSAVAQTNVNAIADDADFVYVATNFGILKISDGAVVDTIESAVAVNDLVCNNGVFAIAGNALYKVENNSLVQMTAGISLSANSRFVKTASGNLYIVVGSGIASFNPSGSPVAELIEPGLSQDIVSATACDENVYVLLSNGKIFEYSTVWNEVAEGNYQSIASAGNGVVWAICNNGDVARICIDCNTEFTISAQPETCDGSINASMTISASGAVSYSIDNGENWQASGSFANISGGYKHLLAKNSTGKIIADSVFFVEYGNALLNQNLTYNQPECFGETGSLSLSSLGASTFVWENNNTSATERTNLGAGNYAVTITSGTCSRILATTIVVKEQIVPNASTTNLLCNGDNSGRIVLNVTGGTLPYTYAWNNNAETANLTNLSAGDYSCTVTDRNSCTVSQSFTITQPDLLSVQAEASNITCYGAENGSISVSVTGGTPAYNYSWNDGIATEDRTNLSSGDYSLTVTDANSCLASVSRSISQPSALGVSASPTNITCYGANNGAISTTVAGGTEPYLYTWQDGANTSDRTNISAGEYSLTVTDANSCVATLSVNIIEPAELIASAQLSPTTCAGANDAQLSASATGGTGVYAQYFWLNENLTPVCLQQQYQNVAPGTYYLVAKDSHNCTDTIQVVVEDAEPRNFDVSVTDATCNGASNGAISITPDSGFTFAWSNGISNTNNANSLSAGNYSVTITDANNCTTVIDTVVTEPEMQLIGSFEDMVLCEGQTYMLDAGSYASYQWSNDATTQTIVVDAEGDYSVTVTDNMGCRLYDEANISFRRPYTGDKLALASVTESNSVILRWNKTENQGTASYRVYRDSGDGFSQIATVGFNNESMYEDTAVNVAEQYYKYKVTAVSNCGDESEVNDFHRTIVLAAICDNNNVCNLNWSPYMGITETFAYILAGDSPDNMEIVDSVLFTTYNYIQMNQYEEGTYYRIMIKMSHPLVLGDATYDRIYSNIVRCGGNDEPPIDPPVAINIDKIGDISAYPNPFGDEITIEFSINGTEAVAYEVVNTLGQIVIEGKDVECPIKLGSELNAGMYFVRLRAGDEVQTIKISKQ